MDYENSFPAVSSEVFNYGDCDAGCTVPDCSCTGNWAHWSSTSLNYSNTRPNNGWFFDFSYGGVSIIEKDAESRVRAVRGGL